MKVRRKLWCWDAARRTRNPATATRSLSCKSFPAASAAEVVAGVTARAGTSEETHRCKNKTQKHSSLVSVDNSGAQN